MPKTRPVLLTLLLATLMVLGCSGSGINPAEPTDTPDLSTAAGAPGSSRILWGIWDISFDISTREISITPARYALAHFDITDWLLPPDCEDCLKISVNSYDPVSGILDADATLRNPTQMAGFDVRGILYTGGAGYLLTNADAWTGVFDIPGGEDINPFKAYAKNMPHRIFFPNKQHKQNYQIYIPDIIDMETMYFAITASWPDNCKEPYAIENFQQDIIYDQVGSSGSIQVDVFDWQGDVSEVIIELPEISGEDETPLALTGPNTWSVELTNATGAFTGTYVGLISAISSGSGAPTLYNFADVIISEKNIEFNPVDITPSLISHNPWNMIVDSNYLYVVGNNYDQYGYPGTDGLHIYDITDPVNPTLVNSVISEWEGEEYLPWDVAVDDGYAYLACSDDYDGLLFILDIDPVESASIVAVIELFDGCSLARDVFVSGGYAYVATWGKLFIVDVSSPESAYITGEALIKGCEEIIVSGDYAYISSQGLSGGGWFWIYDISDAENPEYVSHVEVGSYNWSFDMSGGYAYVVGMYGSKVVDIDPPEEISVINSLDILNPVDIEIIGDYAYLANYSSWEGLVVVDISQPGSEYVLNSLELEYSSINGCRGVAVSGDYAYVSAEGYGIHVVDIATPGSEECIKTVYTMGFSNRISISDGYAFLTNKPQYPPNIAFAADIDPLDSMKNLIPVVKWGGFEDIAATDGHAFLSKSHIYSSLLVYDIDPIESSFQLTTLDIHGTQLEVDNGYLYTLEPKHYDDIQIIDIDPIEEISIVGSVSELGYAKRMAVSDGYIYVCGSEFLIIDAVEPDSPEIIKTLPLDGRDVAVSGGYAFMTTMTDLVIIDVDPPESAHVLATVGEPVGYFYNIKVSGGYAYVGDGYDDYLYIFDVNPPSAAHIVETIELPFEPQDFEIHGNRAYICLGFKGVHVIELW